MRLSPIVLTVLTTSAVLSLTSLSEAKTPDSMTAAMASVDQTAMAPSAADSNKPSNSSDPVQGIAPTVVEPEVLSVDRLSQAPAGTPTDTPPESAPPPGTQTPSQETPNQIQLDVTPPPDLDIEIQEPPTVPPSTPVVPPGTTPPPSVTPPAATEPEPRVLVSEVVVSGAEGELETIVYNAIQTQAGRTATRSQLREDINAIFATGYFANVRAVPEDTPLGVRVTFLVQPNPVLQTVQLQGAQVLTQTVVDDIFSEQYGRILNLQEFQQGIEELNTWYKDNGYVVAQVIGSPQVTENGTVTLEVAEGVIEDIQVRFVDKEGQATDEEGNPIEGRTREFIITREFQSQPGEVFNRTQIEQDLQRAFALGIFEDVQIALNPGQDPRKVDVIVNVTERSTGSVAAGLGVSSASGLFGSVSYQEQNLGGNNQRLSAEAQVGQRDLLFDVAFTDPWIAGDPYRTSYTVNAFSRSSISLIFDGGQRDVTLFPSDNDIEDVLEDENISDDDIDTILDGDVDDLSELETRLQDQGLEQDLIDDILDDVVDEGNRPRVQRLGGGVTFGRPLENGWRASLGAQYQQVSIRDADGDLTPEDALGNELSFSGSGKDDLILVQFAAVRDRRNDPAAPTSGSVLRLSTDQSIPVGRGSILLNRLRGSYSQYFPVDFTDFTDGPETLAFNVQAGTVLGDLPPYEAFSLGGTDSVRGYDAGELGSGRSFVQATVEYRFPIIAIVGGALFFDVGSDLGTGDNVPGEPAIVRDKPGSGFGFGVGVRVQSPVGQIRVDYAINDEGDNQIHFGIGERF